LAGATTSIPAFMQMTPQTRSRLVAAIAEEVKQLINSYSAGGELTFSMSTHISLAT